MSHIAIARTKAPKNSAVTTPDTPIGTFSLTLTERDANAVLRDTDRSLSITSL